MKKFRATRPRAKWKIEAPCIIVLSTSKKAAAVRSAPGGSGRFVLVDGQVGGLGGGRTGDLRGLRLFAENVRPALLHCCLDQPLCFAGSAGSREAPPHPVPGQTIRRSGRLRRVAEPRSTRAQPVPARAVNDNGGVSSPGTGDIGIPSHPGTNVADLLRGAAARHPDRPAVIETTGTQDVGRAGLRGRCGGCRLRRARRADRGSGWSFPCPVVPTWRSRCSPSRGPV